MPIYRGRVIHETDPLLGTVCELCSEKLELGQSVIFDEDAGAPGRHENCHEDDAAQVSPQ